MNYAITENGRAISMDNVKLHNMDARIKALVEWPQFEELTQSFVIGGREITLDKGFGHLLGLYIGDGWCDKNKNRKIHIASVDNGIVSAYRNYINTYLRDKPINGYATGNNEHDYYSEYVSTHGKFSIDISNKVRRDIIRLFGHGAYNKHIPHELLSSPMDFRWGLLSGLIDTDGSVSHRDIIKHGKLQQNKLVNYSTQSWQLARDVQSLSMSLGVCASITISMRKERREFTVVIGSMDIYKLRHNLCCATDKAKKLDCFTFGNYPNPKDVLPFDQEIRDAMTEHDYNRRYQTVVDAAKRSGFIVRDTFYNVSPLPVVELMEKKYNTSSRWERVMGMSFMPDDHTDEDLILQIISMKRSKKK